MSELITRKQSESAHPTTLTILDAAHLTPSQTMCKKSTAVGERCNTEMTWEAACNYW